MSILDNLAIPAAPQQPPSATRSWSPYQLNIFAAASTTQDNLSIEAVAGSGKTTTLIETVARIQAKNPLFLAFNRSIVDEMRAKMRNVDVESFHSFGLKILRRSLGSIELDKRKDATILQRAMSKDMWDECGYDLARVMSLAKNNGIGIVLEPTSDVFQEMLEDANLFLEEKYENWCFANLPRLFGESMAIEDNSISFDDMVYQPIYLKLPFPRHDVVFVDEAQDLNLLQHLHLAELAKNGSRIIAVGDSYQAIYAFRGADSASMNKLAKKFNAKKLPLSVSYRCPISVVAEAQTFVSHIESKPNAPHGNVTRVAHYPHPTEYGLDAMIICRNNAPLFKLAMQFLRDRVPCQLRTNAGKELISFVRKFNAKTIESLAGKMKKWKVLEIAEAQKKRKNARIAFVEERYEILMSVIMECKSVKEVIDTLTKLLYSEFGTILCSIHKSKGLEARHVYILRPDLMPSKWAETPSEIQQERNLHYVAITRAQETLTYLPYEGQY